MNPLLAVLLAIVSRPFHAVSKPVIQAWTRMRRGWYRFCLDRLGVPAIAGGADMALPETAAEMQEILNTPGKAAEWIKAGRFSELVDAYAEKTRPELAEQIADQLKAFWEGQNVIETKVDEKLTEWLKEHGANRPPAPVPEPGTGAELNAAYSKTAPGVPMEAVGFANIGDFTRAVWHRNPFPDKRLPQMREVMDAYSSVEPSAGGFLIPEVMRSEIQQLALEASIVRPRATVISMTTLTQSMPFVDETTHSGSVLGGIVFYWTEEGGTPTVTQAKFGRIKLEANKLMGLAAVPNELFADAAALSSWLMQALPKGLAFYEDVAFLTGLGAGQPLGVLNSPAVIAVTKDDGQLADTITVNNVLGMYSRMLPTSLGNAVWVANINTFKELMTLSLPVGVGGAPVALVDIRTAPFATMLGRPLIYTEKVPTLGDQGDLAFIDFAYYLIGDRQAIEVSTSEHAYFTSDQTALKPVERVDGRPWIQSALTPVAGDTLSPFVVIQART